MGQNKTTHPIKMILNQCHFGLIKAIAVIALLHFSSVQAFTNAEKDQIEELFKDKIEGLEASVSNLKAENLAQNEHLKNLGPIFQNIMTYPSGCTSKYLEVLNKISYINDKISVELSYSNNLPDGIIIQPIKSIGDDNIWRGRVVILPLIGITKYKVSRSEKSEKESVYIRAGERTRSYKIAHRLVTGERAKFFIFIKKNRTWNRNLVFFPQIFA